MRFSNQQLLEKHPFRFLISFLWCSPSFQDTIKTPSVINHFKPDFTFCLNLANLSILNLEENMLANLSGACKG